MSNKDSKSSLLAGLLVGLVSGAIVTLLYTPKTGKAMRKELKDVAEELPNEFQNILEDIRVFYDKSSELLSALAQKQCSKLKEAVSETKKVIDEKLKDSSNE